MILLSVLIFNGALLSLIFLPVRVDLVPVATYGAIAVFLINLSLLVFA